LAKAGWRSIGIRRTSKSAKDFVRSGLRATVDSGEPQSERCNKGEAVSLFFFKVGRDGGCGEDAGRLELVALRACSSSTVDEEQGESVGSGVDIGSGGMWIEVG